jgi:hypothetical protein
LSTRKFKAKHVVRAFRGGAAIDPPARRAACTAPTALPTMSPSSRREE